jgi:hypothetical protein
MRRFAFSALVCVLSLTGLWVSPALADVFVWQDAKTGLSLSFPDTWSVVNTADSDELIRIAAPVAADEAQCRVRARTDRRFVIYPPRYDSSIQKVAYDRAFWSEFLEQEYNEPTIETYKDSGGLGRGYGSSVLASFLVAGPESDSSRRGVAFVALYRDAAYIAECSALRGAYPTWDPVFRSIVKSIDFRKISHELPTGHYRNFLYRTSFWDMFR